MEDEWLLLIFLFSLLMLAMALLCGDWPIFDGTPIRPIHNWFSGGACDCFQKIIGIIFGNRGLRAYEWLGDICCERPNPILQIFYLAILGGTFYAYFETSFKYIPGIYVSSFHRYTGPLSVLFGVLVFIVTSFSDPGTIKQINLHLHQNTYPFDGVLYEEKICTTCQISRPARSKHCSICNRCIARLDHHCGWMNNCIGENNLRYFLLFLAWHCFLCWYGVYILIAILAGEIKQRGVMRKISFYFHRPVSFKDAFPHVLQWVITYYNSQILLLFFLSIVSLLVGGFLCYHLYLVATNTTTNETYKWDHYVRWQAYLAESEAEEKASLSDGRKEEGWLPRCGFWKRFRKSPSSKVKPKLTRNNIYSNGLLNNLIEVIFPLRRRYKIPIHKHE